MAPLSIEGPDTPLVTRTTPLFRTPIIPRQAVITVTAAPSSSSGDSNNGSLSGGAIAGIVIGSVLGVLLIIYIVRWALAYQIRGDPDVDEQPRARRDYYYAQETSRPSRSRSRRRSTEMRTSTTIRPPGSPARVYVVEPRRHHRSKSGRH